MGGCLHLVVVFSLGSSPTVGTENLAKRLQPNVNVPPFHFRSGFNGIYRMQNKTWQKRYFTTILDLEHQQTTLTTKWVAHFWKLTFRVDLTGTGLWMPVANHSEAVTSHQCPVTSHQCPVTSHQCPVTSARSLVPCHQCTLSPSFSLTQNTKISLTHNTVVLWNSSFVRYLCTGSLESSWDVPHFTFLLTIHVQIVSPLVHIPSNETAPRYMKWYSTLLDGSGSDHKR